MIIDNFLDYLKNTRNMSDNTLLAYRRDIMAFDRFMRKQGINELEKATNTNIISYLMFLKTDGKSKSTVNRRLASLRSFFRFLQNQGTIRENPTDDIRSPKIARKEISFLSQEDVKKLLEMPDDSVMGIRDKAILEMMYATGVRVSEIIEMKVTDLNLRMGFVACSGDHGRARIVPMGVPARNAIENYLKNSRNALLKNKNEEEKDGYLFVNYIGEPFTRQGFWKVLKQYGDQADIEEKLTPQTLRNSFAMHMVQNGIGVKSLQELMGHEDIAATQVYFGNTKNRIKDVYDRCHPRAK